MKRGGQKKREKVPEKRRDCTFCCKKNEHI